MQHNSSGAIAARKVFGTLVGFAVVLTLIALLGAVCGSWK